MSKPDISKAYALAARHPEVKALLEMGGESSAEVARLRTYLAGWRVGAVALGVILVGSMAYGDLALSVERTRANDQSARAEAAQQTAKDTRELADTWRSEAEEQTHKMAQFCRDLRAMNRKLEACENENPKWRVGRP